MTAQRPFEWRLAALYAGITFVMAWAFWAWSWAITQGRLTSLSLFLTLEIGSFAPFVAAAICTWHEGGWRHTAHFFGRALCVRMGWAVFLVSVLLLPALAAIAELIHAHRLHLPVSFTMDWSDLPMTYLWLFVLGGTLAEEFGWSYLSDKLDQVLPIGRATFVLGTIWAFWHIPLFFIVAPGLAQAYTPFYMFFLCTVAMRFLFSWSYHRGGRSILSNMLFHTASNLAYSIIVLAPTPDDPSRDKFWYFAIMVIVSALLLWRAAPPRAAVLDER